MKDILGRDIMVGDTLARSSSSGLDLYKVVGKADFAVQLQSPDDEHPFVSTGTSEMVICDWAKGSDAGK